MNRKLAVLLIATATAMALSACDNTQTDEMVDEPVASTTMSGQEAYEQQCAGCHETGMHGAPVVGDRAYWENRSRLWQAVIMDHAKTGYLDMPARGGRSDLSDETIELAVEYMLELTFADLPAD